MSNCPHGAHLDHENRITQNTGDIRTNRADIKELQDMQKDSSTRVALIQLCGVVFSGVMAFLAVVAAPAIQAWLALITG